MEVKNQVAVIVPCYNQASFLAETLKTVYDQTYSHWECIIVNDGSTDNSEEIALDWVNKDSRFKYFLIPNGGVSKARNFGIQQSVGEYILPLDGDDKISDNYIAACLNKINSDKNISLVYTDVQLFGIKKGNWSFGDYSYERLLYINMICCTALYRRSDFNSTNGYNENMKMGLEDWDFWLSLLNQDSKVVKLDSIIFFYRMKITSRSKSLTKNIETQMKRQIFYNHIIAYDTLLPDYITLYNENVFLKNSSLYFQLKNLLKRIIKSNKK